MIQGSVVLLETPAIFEYGHNVLQETVFDPVALKCGHLFCNSCVCEAASVTAFEGPGAARGSAKCPLCRKVNQHSDPLVLLSSLCTPFISSTSLYLLLPYLQALSTRKLCVHLNVTPVNEVSQVKKALVGVSCSLTHGPMKHIEAGICILGLDWQGR